LTDPSEPEIVRNLPATNPAGSAADVGYTLINYNTAAQTLRCVESLAACTPPPAWILVLDNASASADFEHLAANLTAAPASHIQLHRSPQNLGFAAGSNFLVQHLLNTAGCHFIGLLNNDAVAMPGLVAQLKDALTAQPAQPTGMAGGRMHSLHRPHQVDTLGISLYASLMPADRKSAADPYLGPTGGCCLMTRAFVHDIIATTGYFFDARYFCYCEDTDLALRANLLGYRPAYTDQLVAMHEGQASSNAAPGNFITYHGLRNAIWMHLKLVPTPLLVKHLPWLLLAHLLTVIRQTLSGRAGVLIVIYRDALRQWPAIRQDRARLQAAARVPASALAAVISKRFYRQGYAAIVVAEWRHRLWPSKKA
jgi:GT2 family glycosyltransferase